MVAHESNAGARLALRLPPRSESRPRPPRNSNAGRSSDGSDTEDDEPIAAHFAKFTKTERACGGGTATTATTLSDRIDVCTSNNSNSSSISSSVATPLKKSEMTPPVPQSKDNSKRPKPDAPKFLLLLYEILQTENPKVIRWSEDGLSLQILDQSVVTDSILPKYFNHTNFHSFQRQLNYFGFRKWTKSKTDICTFSHTYFRQSQPELLQLIKRKKAPRRPAATAGVAAGDRSAGYQQNGSAKAIPASPTNKRKRAEDAEFSHPSHETAVRMTQLQQHGSAAERGGPMHPSLHGVVIAPLSQHTQQAVSYGAGTPMQRDAAPGQYLQASALLNSVISPLAASESNKKAKKIDNKTYKSEYQSLTDPTTTSMCEFSGTTMHSSSNSSSGQLGSSTVNVYSNSSHSLPTLDIVRNRIIRRQNVSSGAHTNGGSEAQQKQEQYANGYLGYSSPLSGQHSTGVRIPGTAAVTQQTLESTRVELLSEGKNTSSPAAFTNAFSDPVDILLRIKKSRAMSSSEGQLQHGGEALLSPAGAAQGAMTSVDSEQSDNLASLQNFIVSHTLYTNRLESQLKMAIEENKSLRLDVDTKHRELEKMQIDHKMLQHENAVLVEEKHKLFELNNSLTARLFQQ